MNGRHLHELSGSQIVELVAKREVSVRNVVEACLHRLEDINPRLNAVCTVNAEALNEADLSDLRLARGDPPRSLEGVPFVVKDTIQTANLRTTFGSVIFSDYVPDQDAIAVQRMRHAGGILLGKTNTSEFATDVLTTNRLFGPTRNPHDLSVTAGGSSGGTASAIAGGIAPIGLGTDFGGSVRIPASYCGVVGLRPVPGRVPIFPTEFGWDTLVEHVVGPLARTVWDTAMVLDVISGPDDRDPSSISDTALSFAQSALTWSLRGKRVAFSSNLGGLLPVDEEVQELTHSAANRFESFGCSVESKEVDASDLRDIIMGTRAYAVIARFADLYDSHSREMTEQLVRQIREASKADLRLVANAERIRTAYWQWLRAMFDDFDYILTPTVGAPPFRLDLELPTQIGGRGLARYYDVFLATYAFSVVGLPAISVPCGFTAGGLPVGLQIVGRRLREEQVLAAAASFEEACPEQFRSPKFVRSSTADRLVRVEAQGMIFRDPSRST